MEKAETARPCPTGEGRQECWCAHREADRMPHIAPVLWVVPREGEPKGFRVKFCPCCGREMPCR
jgi:hypothetical protein